MLAQATHKPICLGKSCASVAVMRCRLQGRAPRGCNGPLALWLMHSMPGLRRRLSSSRPDTLLTSLCARHASPSRWTARRTSSPTRTPPTAPRASSAASSPTSAGRCSPSPSSPSRPSITPRRRSRPPTAPSSYGLSSMGSSALSSVHTASSAPQSSSHQMHVAQPSLLPFARRLTVHRLLQEQVRRCPCNAPAVPLCRSAPALGRL